MEQQLIAALGVLWAALTAVVGGALTWARNEMKVREEQWQARLAREEDRCAAELSRKDAKLDESAVIIREQTAAAHKIIDNQAALIAQQTLIIDGFQKLAKGSGP